MPDKKRILFVDDEPCIVDGLKRMLYPFRRVWDMTFVNSGEAALGELQKNATDVIVSDMRMPGMDGAALLKRVQEEFPSVVRLVLSGHTELEAALRAVPVAHQFLSKPCEPDTLKDTVERSCNLQDVLQNEEVRKAISGMDALPSVPRVYAQLSKALADPNMGLADVGGILEQDVAMCAKALQLVNSAFFGLSRRITDIRTAAKLLGANMLRNLVLSVDVFRSFKDRVKHPAFSLESLQQHSLLTANLARQLVKDKRQREDAFMAGMLHDVGLLVFASCFPEGLRHLLSVMKERADLEIERNELRVTHAEVGAYLLGIWGLPYSIIEAVAAHHQPQQVEQQQFDVLSAVYAASSLASEVAREQGERSIAGREADIDIDYLQRLGVADDLPAWRELATEQARLLNGVSNGG